MKKLIITVVAALFLSGCENYKLTSEHILIFTEKCKNNGGLKVVEVQRSGRMIFIGRCNDNRFAQLPYILPSANDNSNTPL